MTATARTPSQYVGEVGEELELTGFLNYISPVTSKYGKPRARYIISALGDTVTGFGNLRGVQKGDRIRFTGVVKDHREWNGTAQTELDKLTLVENITQANER